MAAAAGYARFVLGRWRQVHVTDLTSVVRANYDVQFLLDPVAVIDYVIKYKSKPEKRSETMMQLMRNVCQQELRHDKGRRNLIAQMLNVFVGARDYGDVETSHILCLLPLMNWSVVFSDPFRMNGQRERQKDPDQEAAFSRTKEEWYINRCRALLRSAAASPCCCLRALAALRFCVACARQAGVTRAHVLLPHAGDLQ